MAVKVVSQVTIEDKPEAVFKYLSDLSCHFLWNPHLLTLSSLDKLKTGYSYTSTSMLLGVRVKGNNVVTKFAPNKEIQIENKAGLVKYEVNYTLSQNKKNTLLICATTVTASSAFSLTNPVLRMLARRELQSDLRALKIAVEQRLK